MLCHLQQHHFLNRYQLYASPVSKSFKLDIHINLLLSLTSCPLDLSSQRKILNLPKKRQLWDSYFLTHLLEYFRISLGQDKNKRGKITPNSAIL